MLKARRIGDADARWGSKWHVVNLDKRILENAPSYGASDAPDWSSPTYRTGIDEYYHTRH